QRDVRVSCVGQERRDRAAQAQQAPVVLLGRDVAGQPAVANEAAQRVERGAAADAEVVLVAGPLALDDEIGERLPRVEQAPVRVPAPLVDRRDAELPRRLTEHVPAGAGELARRPPYGEAMPLVQLPVAVERKSDDALEAP